MIRLFKYANASEYKDFQNHLFSNPNYTFDFANDKVTIDSVEYRISTRLKSPFETTNTVSGGGSVGGGDNIYSTEGKHFTATPNDGEKTIVLSINTLLGEAITEENFANGILKIYDTSATDMIEVTLDKFTWDSDTKTLDISDCTGAFTLATGDVVNLWITGPKMGYDIDMDLIKTDTPAAWDNWSNKENVVSGSDIGVSDNTWVDQGAEHDVSEVDGIIVWVALTHNNSTGNQIQILCKYENGATDEFEFESLENEKDFVKAIGDTDRKIAYAFPVKGIISIQVQTKATVVGATAGVVTIDLTKQY